MTSFLSDKLKSLTPYTPGEQPKTIKQLIKLNTNESPFPPSPRVAEAITRDAVNDLRLYSDPACQKLREAIATADGVSSDMVSAGNGSDETLAFLFHGFCERGAAFADVTYGFYPVYCEMFGVAASIIPLREDFSIRVADYENCAGTIFIANPNALTGIALPLSDIKTLLERRPDRLVVVDEAYVAFGGESAVPLLSDYVNLLIVRTFSKSHNLAGARLGYAIANPELIADLETLRFSFNPYNVNRLSQLAGTAAMEDVDYFESCRDKILENRAYTVAELKNLGFTVLESASNFVFAGDNQKISGFDYYAKLRENYILVRHFDSTRTKNYVRITIGTREQMEALVRVTKELLSK